MSNIIGLISVEKPVGTSRLASAIPTFSRPETAATAAIARDLKLELVHDLAALAHEWKTLEAAGDCAPFQTFDWLDNWQRHIGAQRSAVPAVVVGRGGDGQVLMILPLAIERFRGVRMLTWLGSQLGDYNAPLLAKDFAAHPAAKDFAAVWRSVTALLRAQAGCRFDLIDLQKMPETVGSQKNPFLQLQVSPNRSAAYITALGKNWDEYYAAKRSSANRKTSRKRQRQLETEHGKLRFEEISDAKEATSALQVLMEQKVQFLARIGAENIFERPGYPEFYNAVVTSGSMAGLVHLSQLGVGDHVGAVSVGFKHRGRFYLFLSSYHPGELAKFGPGTLHLHELLQRCIETGVETFDFTIGDEPYKLDWAETKVVLYDHVTAATALGAVAVLQARLVRGTVRYLKRRAGVWHALKRARAMAGSWRRPGPERAQG